MLVGIFNEIFFDVFLAFTINVLIGNSDYFLGDHANFQVLLKHVNFLSVFLFAAYEPILSPSDIILNFIVLIKHFLRLLNNLREALVPITRLHIFVRVRIVKIYLLHYNMKLKH